LLLALCATGARADECLLGEERRVQGGRLERCEIWDDSAGRFVAPNGGLHDRARGYQAWLRAHHLPAGQVATTFFSDAALGELQRWDDVGDSAMWTGTYLASEAMRLIVTGSPDARRNTIALVRTLHTLFEVTGSPGYLARFAVREDDDPRIVNLVDLTSWASHRSTVASVPYRWRGHTSRDQYQGVVLGLSLAYAAVMDEEVRNLIRGDLVTLARELMKERKLTVRLRLKLGSWRPVVKMKLKLQYVVMNAAEPLEAYIDVGDLDASRFTGLQEFMPTIVGVPAFKRAGSAIMLVSIFQSALRATEGAVGWEAAHQEISSFYQAHVDGWLGVADDWSYAYANDRDCYKSYFGLNIAFEPAYNVVWMGQDPARRARFVGDVLLRRLWPVVDDHHNVFFSYITASSQDPFAAPWRQVVEHASEQLSRFPPAPRLDLPNDVSPIYPGNPSCPGQSRTPIEVQHRNPADFLWQRSPFGLSTPGTEGKVFPGVDYLAAYWLGRFQGFLEDDSPSTRTRWRREELEERRAAVR
jgi:hypothetical protein